MLSAFAATSSALGQGELAHLDDFDLKPDQKPSPVVTFM